MTGPSVYTQRNVDGHGLRKGQTAKRGDTKLSAHQNQREHRANPGGPFADCEQRTSGGHAHEISEFLFQHSESVSTGNKRPACAAGLKKTGKASDLSHR
jgi:hypothetical protein